MTMQIIKTIYFGREKNLQVADLSIIKYGLLSNEGITGYILK